MNKGKILTIGLLLLFCVIVILPPIIHGYVYPNLGDDSSVHLASFDKIRDGVFVWTRLSISYGLVGYPMAWISNQTGWSINAIYLWFCYIALIMIGITIYIVMSKLVNKVAGWLSLILTLFCAQGILFQFYYGQIFNAINIGIILPILIFFLVRYITQGKIYQLVFVICMSILFVLFHPSGIYLPFVAGLSTVVYVIYSLLKKQRILRRIALLGGSLFVVPCLSYIVVAPLALTKAGWYGLIMFMINQEGELFPIGGYILGIVSVTILILVVFILVFLKDILRCMVIEVKVVGVILSCMVIVLLVVAFGKISLDPFRQALDMATILALLAAVIVSAFVAIPKNKRVTIVLLLVMIFGLYHNLPTWFGYNSAIRLVDNEAISYVNTLNYGNYNCSPQVAPWIYDRFMTSSKYIIAPDANGLYAPILIVRDLPMTPRSDPENKWYDKHGIEFGSGFIYKNIAISDHDFIIKEYKQVNLDNDYILLKTFSDGEVTIEVYKSITNGIGVPILD